MFMQHFRYIKTIAVVIKIYKSITGYSIFVQYFGVIDALIRHIIMNFSIQNAKSRALTHVMQNFILFKLTNVEIYQTKYIVYAFTEI